MKYFNGFMNFYGVGVSAIRGLGKLSVIYFFSNTILAAPYSLNFPARADDLPIGHYWYMSSDHDSQTRDDFTGARYDTNAGRFTKAREGTGWNGGGPEEAVIYGTPVYANPLNLRNVSLHG